MRVADNDDQLAQLILADMQTAVQATEKKAMDAMRKGIEYFYAGGFPDRYIRTEQLKKTPRTTGVQVKSKKHVEFDAFLDESLPNYTTGKHPSMGEVLQLTNEGSYPGLRPAVGSPGYWDWAEVQIGKDFEDAMKQYFD